MMRNSFPGDRINCLQPLPAALEVIFQRTLLENSNENAMARGERVSGK